MVNTLTTGAIWKNKKTGKEFELVDVNKGSGKVQLANRDGYSCMTENSLRKNYTLTALKTEPEPALPISVEEPAAETREPEPQATGKRGQAGRVELSDGRVIAGIRFLLDVAKKTETETCKNSSVIFWLTNTKAGQELLAQFNAKVVYNKPLIK